MTDKDIQDKITKYDLLFESRLTRTETMCENLSSYMDIVNQILIDIRNEIRWGFIILIVLFSIICGIMAHGFKWF
jgi:hypothetical protein